MLKRAFELGMQRALIEAGLAKEAGALTSALTNPLTIGATMGAAGGLLTGDEEPAWKRALRGGAVGGAIGGGVRYLPKLLKKIPGMAPGGQLAPGAADLSWMAPSLLAAPLIMEAGREEEDDTKAGKKARMRRARAPQRGKR